MATKESIRTMERDKRLCRNYHIKLNNNTDADIIEHLDNQTSMQGYIKSLIRADMAKQKENHNGTE